MKTVQETTAAEGTTAAMEPVTISLMHDKGGNPNFQPFYEAMSVKTKELFGITGVDELK